MTSLLTRAQKPPVFLPPVAGDVLTSSTPNLHDKPYSRDDGLDYEKMYRLFEDKYSLTHFERQAMAMERVLKEYMHGMVQGLSYLMTKRSLFSGSSWSLSWQSLQSFWSVFIAVLTWVERSCANHFSKASRFYGMYMYAINWPALITYQFATYSR
jgi:hypothetical protein